MAAPKNILIALEEAEKLKVVKQKRKTLENVSESPVQDFTSELNAFLDNEVEILIRQDDFSEYAENYKDHITPRTISRLFHNDAAYPTTRVLNSLLLYLKVPYWERDIYLSDDPQHLDKIAQDQNIECLPEIDTHSIEISVDHKSVINNLSNQRWYSLTISTDQKIEDELVRISSWVFLGSPHSEDIIVQINNGHKMRGSLQIEDTYSCLALHDSTKSITKQVILPAGKLALSQQNLFVFISSVRWIDEASSSAYFELLFSYKDGPFKKIQSLQENGWTKMSLAELINFSQNDERLDAILDHVKKVSIISS